MKRICMMATALLVLPPSARPAPGDVKDLAELFPARTRAYLEINQIGQVVKELGSLLKGSVLDDLPASMEKLRSKIPDDYVYAPLLQLCAYVGPESLAEVSRFKGAAVGVLDLEKEGQKEPQVVAVLLSGDSNVPGMMMRAALAGPGGLHKAAYVDGVGIYCERQRVYPSDGGDGAKHRDIGPALAMAPGAVFLGTSTEAVKEVVSRYQGKAVGASLASVAELQKASALRRQAGLFGYADVDALRALGPLLGRLSRRVDGAYPLPLHISPYSPYDPYFGGPHRAFDRREREEKPGDTPIDNLVASLRGFRTLSAALTLSNGELELRGSVTLDAKNGGAWSDFFSARTVDVELLHYVPRHAALVAQLAMPEGERFWNKLGKTAPGLESFLSLTLGGGVLDKITRVLMVDVRPLGSEAASEGPVWIVELGDAKSAAELARAFADKASISPEARRPVVVLGGDEQTRKHMIAEGVRRKGLLADANVAAALKGHDKAHLLLAWSPAHNLADRLRQEAREMRSPRTPQFEFQPWHRKGIIFEEAPDLFDGSDAFRRSYAKELDGLAARLTKSLKPVPPCLLSITRSNHDLTLSGKQPRAQAVVGRLLSALLEWDLRQGSVRFNRFDEFSLPPGVGPFGDW